MILMRFYSDCPACLPLKTALWFYLILIDHTEVRKMKILAIEKELAGASLETFQPHVKAEAFRAWELYQSGIFREMYFMADRKCAVLIMECDTIDEAKKALGTLPLVKAGLITFDLIPLVAYPGFARLFA